MTTALEGGDGSASRPGRSLSPVKNRYSFYRRLVGPQGWSGQVRKISPPRGFDPLTVQPVATRYIDYATRPTWDPILFTNYIDVKGHRPTELNMTFNVNIICKQYGIAQCAHSLNVPVLCFVFGLMMVQ